MKWVSQSEVLHGMFWSEGGIDAPDPNHRLREDLPAYPDHISRALPPIGHDGRDPNLLRFREHVRVEEGLLCIDRFLLNFLQFLPQFIGGEPEAIFDLFVFSRTKTGPTRRNVLNCRAQFSDLPHLFRDRSLLVVGPEAIDELQ
jgi:hypothetical protein